MEESHCFNTFPQKSTIVTLINAQVEDEPMTHSPVRKDLGEVVGGVGGQLANQTIQRFMQRHCMVIHTREKAYG